MSIKNDDRMLRKEAAENPAAFFLDIIKITHFQQRCKVKCTLNRSYIFAHHLNRNEFN